MNRPYKSQYALLPQNPLPFSRGLGLVLGDLAKITPENLPKMEAKTL